MDTSKREKNDKEDTYRGNELLRDLNNSNFIDDKEFEKIVADVNSALKNKFNNKTDISQSDISWGVADKIIEKTIQENNNQALASTCNAMALFLHKTGKNPRELQKMAIDINLYEYINSGVVKTVKIYADESCDECLKNNGKELTPEEAKQEGLLPCIKCKKILHKNAKFGWCKCFYKPEKIGIN